MIPVILRRGIVPPPQVAPALTIDSPSYPNLSTSRPSSATIGVQKGATTVNISDGTSPIWSDFADGSGGGVMTGPNYTTGDISSLGGRIPSIVSGTNPGPFIQTNTAPGAVVDANGDIGVEVEWIVCWGPDQYTRYFDNYYAWAGISANGETSLRYEWPTNSWYLKVEGVDRVQAGVIGGGDGRVMTWRQGDRFRARAWYRPSTGESGIRLACNGVWGRITTSTASTPLIPLTSFYWGSDLSFGNNLLAQHTLHNVGGGYSATPSVKFIDIGDSTCASYGQMVNVASTYLTPAQRKDEANFGVSLAVPGQTTVTQLATYNASEYVTATGVQWAFIRLGLNDIGNYSPSQWMTNMRAIISKLRSDHPGIKVGVGGITPAYTYWVNQFGVTLADSYYADWQVMNANVAGSGPDPLTQADFVATTHVNAMLGPDGKSMLSSLTPDGIHPYNNGRVGYISPSQLAAIHGAGFLL